MKKVLFAILFFVSINATAQIDSLTQTYAPNPITVTIPVKAVVMYASYLHDSPSWADRTAPDYFKTMIGSGNLPDSLVTVTMKAEQLAVFVLRLQAERFGAIDTVNHSIFNNSPAIPGYTALITQVVSKANGAGAQKNAAIYVRERYLNYRNTLYNLYGEMYQKGLNWIRN